MRTGKLERRAPSYQSPIMASCLQRSALSDSHSVLRLRRRPARQMHNGEKSGLRMGSVGRSAMLDHRCPAFDLPAKKRTTDDLASGARSSQQIVKCTWRRADRRRKPGSPGGTCPRHEPLVLSRPLPLSSPLSGALDGSMISLLNSFPP